MARIITPTLAEAKNAENTTAICARQAPAQRNFSDLRDQVQQLRGQVETLKTVRIKKDAEMQEKIDPLVKINFVKTFWKSAKRTAGTAADSTTSGKDQESRPKTAVYQQPTRL